MIVQVRDYLSPEERSKPWASRSKTLKPTPERLGASAVLVPAARVKLASLYNARMERATQSLVRHVMFANLEWITETEPLDAALEYMERRGAGVMPVRGADGRPKGLLRTRDVDRAAAGTAGEACSTWVSIDADASLEEALGVMEIERLGRVPVEADGKVVGGITRGHILDYQRYEREVERELGIKLAELSHDVSPQDTMFEGLPSAYLAHGASALKCIKRGLAAAGMDAPSSILDFGCGHGRTLRYLVKAYPGATLIGTDVNPDAVEFSKQALGVEAIQSHEDPRQVVIPGTFDLIWCASVVTHVDQDRWPLFLALFESHLSERGALIFTIGGEHVVNHLRNGGPRYGIGPEGRKSVLAQYEQTGFGYVDYPDQSNYGVTISSQEWVRGQIAAATSLRVVDLLERGLDDHQDVVTCAR